MDDPRCSCQAESVLCKIYQAVVANNRAYKSDCLNSFKLLDECSKLQANSLSLGSSDPAGYCPTCCERLGIKYTHFFRAGMNVNLFLADGWENTGGLFMK